jgi:hypothetical protein
MNNTSDEGLCCVSSSPSPSTTTTSKQASKTTESDNKMHKSVVYVALALAVCLALVDAQEDYASYNEYAEYAEDYGNEYAADYGASDNLYHDYAMRHQEKGDG